MLPPTVASWPCCLSQTRANSPPATIAYSPIQSAKSGNRGLLAKQALKIQVFELRRELETVSAEYADWDRRLALLRADQVDRDLLEERARTVLGRVHKNDLVIVQPFAQEP